MNEQLSDMAIKDQLTGLYNRQGFEGVMQEWNYQNELNKAVIYIDLDNFKYYNDNFGHELGDYVLVRFAQALSEVSQNIGYAVRYGGDEFVVVLNESNASGATSVVKEIFKKLETEILVDIQAQIGNEHTIPEGKKLDFSAGIAECKGKGGVYEALNNADKALYYIKKSTKNNYIVWDELKNK